MNEVSINLRDIITEYAEEQELELLFADGFDAAICGLGRQFNRYMVVYDREKCIIILQGQGMTREEAEEYFEFNVVGAYVGESTPMFLEVPSI